MASTQQNRATFIQSALSYLKTYDLDGIDFDWEFPCSPPRVDEVKFSCDDIVPHNDTGSF